MTTTMTKRTLIGAIGASMQSKKPIKCSVFGAVSLAAALVGGVASAAPIQ